VHGGVLFSEMLAAFERLPPRAVVLLHASCHNPTGADLSQDQWRELLSLVKRRQLLPFIDMAYQGLGEGADADAYGLRLFCAELPEALCAVSCSKNFGLYRERTGSQHLIGSSPAAADAALSQLVRLARGIWSMPPDHGAAIVHAILRDEPLRRQWAEELEAMRRRIEGLRLEVVQQLRVHCPQRDFGFIARQRGMFSFFGIDTAQVHALRERHHIYMTDDSRMNIAGLRRENLEYFARAVAQVLAG
jgi:aspartate aminotransferase